MKFMTFSVLFLMLLGSMSAQSLSRSVFASQGGDGRVEGADISWTLGESFVYTSYTDRMIVTEGFHQPLLPISGIQSEESMRDKTSALFSSVVYPNPFRQRTTVQLNQASREDLKLVVFDLKGQIVMQRIIPAGSHVAEVEASNLPAATYYLKIQFEGKTKGLIHEIVKIH
jgi:hypothetical protein